MTVRELEAWCRNRKDKDAKIYFCQDWDETDENGNLTDLYDIDDITEQTCVVDNGLDFEDITEYLLVISARRA